MYNAIPVLDITPPEGGDMLSLFPGDEFKASFGNKLYPARVVAVGKYAKCQKMHIIVAWLMCSKGTSRVGIGRNSTNIVSVQESTQRLRNSKKQESRRPKGKTWVQELYVHMQYSLHLGH